jgi:hypothetical protein
MLTTLSVLVTAFSIAVLAPTPAVAKPDTAPRSTTLGADVSWPQCGSTLPAGQAFGVVGVNGGVANNTNPCLSKQLAWAQASTSRTGQPRVAVYVNTANPGLLGKWWPAADSTRQGTSVVNPYGTCTHGDDAACAYVYGYSMAEDDATIRGVPSPGSLLWWLDVETMNTWSPTDLRANAASLEGMTAYLTGIGAQVGIYSTSYQWGVIAGRPSAGSNLNGLQSWLAGASSETNARSRCISSAPLTTGGRVSMVQFVSKGQDYDVSCQ